MAETEIEVPEGMRAAAQARGFPIDKLREYLKQGVAASFIENTLKAPGVTDEQAIERFATFKSLGGIPALDMKWAQVPTDRLPRLKPGPRGLRLADVEIGAYGFVPDRWRHETMLPRGANPPPNDGIPSSYTIYDKSEVWADCVRDLYEDAIQDRWSAARDISWGTIEPLPDHIEASVCQLMTNWSEDAMIGAETICKWLEQISYGYHEVKLFLSTQAFDLARHVEAFRKRALANGGGLGVQAPGAVHRIIFSAMKYTEMITYLCVQRTSFFLTLLETQGLALAHNEAERKLYAYTVQDLKRHLEYGLEHLKYYVQSQPEKRSYVSAWLGRGEAFMAGEINANVPQNEALILLLDDRPAAGKRKLQALRKQQVEEYIQRLQAATITRSYEQVLPALRRLAEA